MGDWRNEVLRPLERSPIDASIGDTQYGRNLLAVALHNSQLGTRDNGENDNNDSENGNNDDKTIDRQLLKIIGKEPGFAEFCPYCSTATASL